METSSEQGQSLIEAVMLLSALALLFFAALPKTVNQIEQQIQKVSLTKDVQR
jgi:type II secretory pathway component PulJ